MAGNAAKVVITERQQEILDEFSRSRTEPSFLRQRSALILLAFSGLLNEQIAPQVRAYALRLLYITLSDQDFF
jgi:hypothetical protein